MAAGPEAGHPLAGQPERAARLGPGGDRQDDAAFQGLDPDLRAEKRLLERQWQLALEVVASPREPAVGQDADDDLDVAAARRLAGQPDPFAGVGALRDRDLEALAVDVEEPGRAVVRLRERDLGLGLVDGPGSLGRGGSAAAVGTHAHPAQDVVEARAAR